MPRGSLFYRLREASGEIWESYCGHKFVEEIARGELDRERFIHYLEQDYKFLFHFGRAYGLGAYKARSLVSFAECVETMEALSSIEIAHHVEYCKVWGISEEDLGVVEESVANLTYTRYVLECGMSGDELDLHTALSPCVVGYAEIGIRCKEGYEEVRNNPYQQWIDTYYSMDYQEVANKAVRRLDRLSQGEIGEGSLARLIGIFREAVRLEVGFWDMSYNMD